MRAVACVGKIGRHSSAAAACRDYPRLPPPCGELESSADNGLWSGVTRYARAFRAKPVAGVMLQGIATAGLAVGNGVASALVADRCWAKPDAPRVAAGV